ncbi:MAG TPA: hypothetical protein PK786_10060 [Treponemataceae bacterium]|nr:hypothetical protein [Treponemataceae bacterium]
METKARFLQYTDKICRDESGRIQDGDILLPKMIMRFKNGLLHGEGEPAVSCTDGHLEFWKNGRLHKENGPAVVNIMEQKDGIDYEEYWINGERIS